MGVIGQGEGAKPREILISDGEILGIPAETTEAYDEDDFEEESEEEDQDETEEADDGEIEEEEGHEEIAEGEETENK